MASRIKYAEVHFDCLCGKRVVRKANPQTDDDILINTCDECGREQHISVRAKSFYPQINLSDDTPQQDQQEPFPVGKYIQRVEDAEQKIAKLQQGIRELEQQNRDLDEENHQLRLINEQQSKRIEEVVHSHKREVAHLLGKIEGLEFALEKRS